MATQNLKYLFLILQTHSNFRAVLAKIQAIKQLNCPYFQICSPSVLSIFKNRTCVLHHLAFLEWLPTRIFPSPITHFLPLKTHFLNGYFALLCHAFSGSKRFCLCHSCGYLCLLHCILLHFALRLAAKRTAFSSILPCVQRQNALHLAAYCMAFSTKTHYIQRQIAPKWVQMAVV